MTFKVPCGNRGCDLKIRAFPRTNTMRLCKRCARLVERTTLPLGGYIPSPALQTISRELVKQLDKQDLNRAVIMMRGKRHPRGNWEDRPVFRTTPLKYGRWDRRLPHLLVGRKRKPTPVSVAMAYVHSALGHTVLDQHRSYCRYLAGATFFGTRGLHAPKGRHEEAGPSSLFRLPFKDISIIGTHIWRACKKAGMREKDQTLAAWITTRYLQGVESGEFNPPVFLPWKAMPTAMAGDNIFAHRLPKSNPRVPPAYRWKIRRADGKIERQWPEMPWEADFLPAPPPPPKREPTPRPDTGWLFD